MKGTVKFFDGIKGWGFITDETEKDVFVHYSSIQMEGRKSLNQNDIVGFEIGEGPTHRRQAVNVQLILTYMIVKKALKNEGYYIKPIKDQYNIDKYIIMNSEGVLQTDVHGMSFAELVAYAGLHYPM